MSAPIAPGSLVLVTGGTGFIGSHVVRTLLSDGFRVRLPVRSVEKSRGLVEHFEKLYPGKVQTVHVPDGFKPGAYDDAVKGVDGIAHLATVMDFTDSASYDKVIPPAIEGTLSVIRSAHQHGSDVKRIVVCSSSTASGVPKPVLRSEYDSAEKQQFSYKTWNDTDADGVQKRHKSGEAQTPYQLYSASKVLAERAARDFVTKEKPSFTLVTIQPNANFGDLIPGATGASTGNWVASLAKGDTSSLYIPPQWFVNVDDTARLHVLALSSDEVQPNERIWAVGGPYGWNDIIDEILAAKPDAPIERLPADKDTVDATIVEYERAKELLKPFGGLQDLRTTVRQNLGLDEPRFAKP